MTDILKEQTCPRCGAAEDQASSHWDEDEIGEACCWSCEKTYYAEAVYQFLGWRTQTEEDRLNEDDE